MADMDLWVDDDHALSRVGFRGVLRNLEGVDVRVMTGNPGHVRRPVLSSGQRRMLGLIAAGFTAERIAEVMELSTAVAEARRLHAMEQLGLDQIAAEVRYARSVGLVEEIAGRPR